MNTPFSAKVWTILVTSLYFTLEVAGCQFKNCHVTCISAPIRIEHLNQIMMTVVGVFAYVASLVLVNYDWNTATWWSRVAELWRVKPKMNFSLNFSCDSCIFTNEYLMLWWNMFDMKPRFSGSVREIWSNFLKTVISYYQACPTLVRSINSLVMAFSFKLWVKFCVHHIC